MLSVLPKTPYCSKKDMLCGSLLVKQCTICPSLFSVCLQAAATNRDDEGQQWLLVGRSGQQTLQIDGKQVDVWISGIRPRLDTPLAWLHLQLHHPDHFLYIVLHVY